MGRVRCKSHPLSVIHRDKNPFQGISRELSYFGVGIYGQSELHPLPVIHGDESSGASKLLTMMLS